MLKLTNSFYRYLFTCEKVNKANVRSYSSIGSKKKTCGADCLDVNLSVQFHSSAQFHGKKRVKIKIPPLNSNECKNHKPMTDPLQPTSNHVSYGGHFEVLSDNEGSYQSWQREACEAARSDDGDRNAKCSIPADFRTWETVTKHSDTDDGCSFKFKVLSYNVLAQYLLECHPYLYTKCVPHDLKWKVRAERIYEEITNLAPDILCFQEVQLSHVNSFYSRFEQIGYFGVFKQKTGHRQDGCAIYFKESLFEMKDQNGVEFFQPELPILNRDNIGMMVRLSPRNLPDTSLVVATTHLLYNPKRSDVKLAQMQVFLAEIDRFAYYNNDGECGHYPIILTGDFNSTPDSAVIKLLDRGQVSASPLRDSSDWKRIGVTDNCQHLTVFLNRQTGRNTETVSANTFTAQLCNLDPGAGVPTEPCSEHEQFSELFNSHVIRQSLGLCSVYDKVKPNGQLEASTYQDYWVTVDYIYFSSCSSLRLLERLRLPTVPECDVLRILPNSRYGSDHLALAALFELKSVRSLP